MAESLASMTRFLVLQDKTDICERFEKITPTNSEALQKLNDFAPKHKVLDSLILPYKCPSHCKGEASNACKFFYILTAVSVGLPLPQAIPTVPAAKDQFGAEKKLAVSKLDQETAAAGGEGESKTSSGGVTTNAGGTVLLNKTKTRTEHLAGEGSLPKDGSQTGGIGGNTSGGSASKENTGTGATSIGTGDSSSGSGTGGNSTVTGSSSIRIVGTGPVATMSPLNTSLTSATKTDQTGSKGKEAIAVVPQLSSDGKEQNKPAEDKKPDTDQTGSKGKEAITVTPQLGSDGNEQNKPAEEKKADTKVATTAPKPAVKPTTVKPLMDAKTKEHGAPEGEKTKKLTTASPPKPTTKASVENVKPGEEKTDNAANKETATPTKNPTTENSNRDTDLPVLVPTKDYSSEYDKKTDQKAIVVPESSFDSHGSKAPNEDVESSHFMAYFLTIVVVCIVGYVLFHNKQKIIAFILEGRGNQRRRQAQASNVEYRKLSSNVDEVLPAADKKVTTQNYIY